MAAEAGGDVRAGIGTRLKAAREKKGLTILQAAEKMHVDARILESLEAENFAVLGAAVYVKGHMRHYAELVGEQASELQELYAASTRAAPAQPDLTRISRVSPDTDVTKMVGPAVVALVAIAAIGTLWWLVSAPSEKPLPRPLQESAQREEGTASGPAAARAEPSSAIVENPAPAPIVSRRNPPGAGAQPGSNSKVAKSGPVSTNTAATATPAVAKTVPQSAAAGAPTTAPPASRTKEGQLTLKFSSDSWAEVYDASGQRLFYDVGSASSAHTVKGPLPMRVVLGNASGVALEYNGHPASVPAAVMPDGSVRFVVNAHGRVVPAAAEGN